MARGRLSIFLGALVGASMLLTSTAVAAPTATAPAAPAPAPARAAVAADTSPPPPVATLTARASDGRVHLSWTYGRRPADFADVLVRRYSGETITTTGPEGVSVHQGRGTSFVDAGLPNGTPVNYAIYVRDTSSNYSAVMTVTGVVPAPIPATSLTSTSSKARVSYGEATALHAELLRTDTAAPIEGELLEFYARAAGSGRWGLIGRVRTVANGTADITYSPKATSEFQVRRAATPFFRSSVSNVSTTAVAPKLIALVASVFLGTDEPITVTGSLHPSHPGQAIYLQRKAKGGQWQSVASTTLGGTGTYKLALRTGAGEYDYRVHKPADVDHLSVTSAPTHVTVTPRTLSSGMSGRDVLALQQQLARLRYDVGPINGKFGYETLHALRPFQKVNGLKRTGVVDAATRAKLAKPLQAVLRERRSGNQIEIDLRKQVLIAGTNGVVTRVLDISTGGGYMYEDEGKMYKADTPVGRFRIQRKINGVRVSRLGELYRPAYFVGGYAIHGSPSVPTYPASHGCIRVTNQSQDRQYDLLTIGTSVWIF